MVTHLDFHRCTYSTYLNRFQLLDETVSMYFWCRVYFLLSDNIKQQIPNAIFRFEKGSFLSTHVVLAYIFVCEPCGTLRYSILLPPLHLNRN